MTSHPTDHNAQEHRHYEAAVKSVISRKLHELSAREAEQVNIFVNGILEVSRKEKAEKNLAYGEWTDDELEIMSLMSMQRAWDEDDADLVDPTRL